MDRDLRQDKKEVQTITDFVKTFRKCHMSPINCINTSGDNNDEDECYEPYNFMNKNNEEKYLLSISDENIVIHNIDLFSIKKFKKFDQIHNGKIDLIKINNSKKSI